MIIDDTIHMGDVILAIISLIFIPVIRSLSSSLFQLRDTVRDLKNLVGTGTSGLIADVSQLKAEIREHRDWLIEIKDRRHP